MSNKRVQTVLTYAQLNELVGGTDQGSIEAIVTDPVRRVIRIIFAGTGSPKDGTEPWAIPFYALQPSPPSTDQRDSSPESTVDGGEQTQ